MSGHIPQVEGFDLGSGDMNIQYPTGNTPNAKGFNKSPIVGTDEDRNSKGINGLLELAGTQYQVDQIGKGSD